MISPGHEHAAGNHDRRLNAVIVQDSECCESRGLRGLGVSATRPQRFRRRILGPISPHRTRQFLLAPTRVSCLRVRSAAASTSSPTYSSDVSSHSALIRTCFVSRYARRFETMKRFRANDVITRLAWHVEYSQLHRP